MSEWSELWVFMRVVMVNYSGLFEYEFVDSLILL